MKIRREDSARTRERLIAAASEVFAEKDYSIATIAEICERAEANVAAVNYHFGDKETLYREAWRNAFRTSVQARPADGGVSDNAPPEERLRGMVVAVLGRITDESNKEFFIVLRELASPTGLLDEVMETELLPMHQRMETVVHELLGLRSSRTQVQFCTISIINQCVSAIFARNSERPGGNDNKAFPPKIDDVDAYAEHVVQFSLGGIRAILDKALREYKRP
jgi:AcrR family transcriptional regulator